MRNAVLNGDFYRSHDGLTWPSLSNGDYLASLFWMLGSNCAGYLKDADDDGHGKRVHAAIHLDGFTGPAGVCHIIEHETLSRLVGEGQGSCSAGVYMRSPTGATARFAVLAYGGASNVPHHDMISVWNLGALPSLATDWMLLGEAEAVLSDQYQRLVVNDMRLVQGSTKFVALLAWADAPLSTDEIRVTEMSLNEGTRVEPFEDLPMCLKENALGRYIYTTYHHWGRPGEATDKGAHTLIAERANSTTVGWRHQLPNRTNWHITPKARVYSTDGTIDAVWNDTTQQNIAAGVEQMDPSDDACLITLNAAGVSAGDRLNYHLVVDSRF